MSDDATATAPVRAAAAPHGPASLVGLRLALLGTMAIWGGNVSIVKLLLNHFDTMVLSVGRMASAAVLLLLMLRWQRPAGAAPLLRLLTPRLTGALLLCALTMVYLNQITFTWGIRGTHAANAALIIALNPLVSTLGAALVFGERLSWRRTLGIALGFGGVVAVVLHRPGMSLGGAGVGDLLVFGSVVFWVIGGLMVQRLAKRLDTAAISTLVTTLGTLMLMVHVVFDPSAHAPDPARIAGWLWPLMAASGVAATALGSLVWNRGVQRLGISRVSLFVYWVPLFGVAVAVGWLGEPFSVWHVVGLAGVLAGTWLGTKSG